MKTKDLHSIVSVGIPVGSLLLCTIFALIGSEAYYRFILYDEGGYLEHSTVLMLIPSVVMAFWMFAHRERFPNSWVGAWALLMALGALYFAGEEASWGQNYIGWATPDWWQALNDQGETNIHNTHGVFDHLPRFFLTCASIVACILPLAVYRRRKTWDEAKDWREWIFPTMASFPIALITALVGLPQKLYRHYGDKEDAVYEWFDARFLRGHHSELKEHFFAMFILIYVLSLFYRYYQFYQRQPESPAQDS
ncbi:MAG: hypothetical protein JXR73_17375 [Candidatus Omnitrophica bacterium]|nr:hypothetical protein [Candidatus Omnitrophota bacterium]